MTTLFTADTHFGHGGALGLFRRPFSSVQEMDAALISAWNAAVQPNDEIWHIGDFAVRHRDPAALLAGLHGVKHLVPGNNDAAGIRELPGWTSVCPLVELERDGVKLILCHYALRTWPGMGRGTLNLHGHSHGRLPPKPDQFDVGVEARGFRPVRLREL